MQTIFGSAKAPINQPVFLAANHAILQANTSLLQRDITFGDEGGADRCLFIMYASEGTVGQRVHSAPKYNSIAGNFHGHVKLDNAVNCTISISYWIESKLPSTSGAKEFEMTLDGNDKGHMMRAFLFKNVDQLTPLGLLVKSTTSNGVPTFQMSNTALDINKGLITGVCMADRGPTYVSGDLKDNGSNMNDIIELQARDPAVPDGGAFASSWDIVPANNETYIWDCKYGVFADVDATVSILAPINPAP